MVNCQGHHVCGNGLSDDTLRSKRYECLNQRVKLILVYIKAGSISLGMEKKKNRVQTKVGEKDLKCFRADHGNEFALVSCDGDSMRRNK